MRRWLRVCILADTMYHQIKHAGTRAQLAARGPHVLVPARPARVHMPARDGGQVPDCAVRSDGHLSAAGLNDELDMGAGER